MSQTPDAFFVPDGDGWYVATDHTRGPWDPDAQHAGPPSALLGTALARAGDPGGRRVARVTTGILRPVPVTRLRVEAEVVRPGRRVELVEGRLSDDDGEILVARAWRLRTKPVERTEHVMPDPGTPVPAEGRGAGLSSVPWDIGYHTAMELRVAVGGAFDELGPAIGWMRMRYPLIAGEDTLPLARVLCAADSGNGLSASLPLESSLFINPELTVHLIRDLVGEWVCLDARTIASEDGIGLATTTLSDPDGVIGHGAQSLLLDRR